MAINIFKVTRSISRIAISIWVIIFISLLIYILVGRTSIWDIDPLMYTILFAIMLLGSLFIFAFTYAMGRRVRSFMGIPTGQDHKNKPDNSAMNDITSMAGPIKNIGLPAQD
jgi:hypothetical protein